MPSINADPEPVGYRESQCLRLSATNGGGEIRGANASELATGNKAPDPTLARHLYDLHVIRDHYNIDHVGDMVGAARRGLGRSPWPEQDGPEVNILRP